jgi:hypothetical protein
MGSSVKSSYRGRTVIIIVALISAIPFGIAWHYARHPELIEKTSNYGTLILPGQSLDRSLLRTNPVSTTKDLEQINGRWLLLQVVQGDCNTICAETLHKTHQGWLMLNKEMPRVKRLLLLNPSEKTQTSDAVSKDDALLISALSPAVLNGLTSALGEKPQPGTIILMDPDGNLVLWYAQGFDPYRMVKDLKHLLNASQIG